VARLISDYKDVPVMLTADGCESPSFECDGSSAARTFLSAAEVPESPTLSSTADGSPEERQTSSCIFAKLHQLSKDGTMETPRFCGDIDTPQQQIQMSRMSASPYLERGAGISKISAVLNTDSPTDKDTQSSAPVTPKHPTSAKLTPPSESNDSAGLTATSEENYRGVFEGVMLRCEVSHCADVFDGAALKNIGNRVGRRHNRMSSAEKNAPEENELMRALRRRRRMVERRGNKSPKHDLSKDQEADKENVMNEIKGGMPRKDTDKENVMDEIHAAACWAVVSEIKSSRHLKESHEDLHLLSEHENKENDCNVLPLFARDRKEVLRDASSAGAHENRRSSVLKKGRESMAAVGLQQAPTPSPSPTSSPRTSPRSTKESQESAWAKAGRTNKEHVRAKVMQDSTGPMRSARQNKENSVVRATSPARKATSPARNMTSAAESRMSRAGGAGGAASSLKSPRASPMRSTKSGSAARSALALQKPYTPRMGKEVASLSADKQDTPEAGKEASSASGASQTPECTSVASQTPPSSWNSPEQMPTISGVAAAVMAAAQSAAAGDSTGWAAARAAVAAACALAQREHHLATVQAAPQASPSSEQLCIAAPNAHTADAADRQSVQVQTDAQVPPCVAQLLESPSTAQWFNIGTPGGSVDGSCSVVSAVSSLTYGTRPRHRRHQRHSWPCAKMITERPRSNEESPGAPTGNTSMVSEWVEELRRVDPCPLLRPPRVVSPESPIESPSGGTLGAAPSSLHSKSLVGPRGR